MKVFRLGCLFSLSKPVYKLDRFSRNKYEATVHKNTLKNNGVKVPESVIREYYGQALKMEGAVLINLFISKIVLYNDKIEIYFNTPLIIVIVTYGVGFCRLYMTADEKFGSTIDAVSKSIAQLLF